MNDLNFDSNTSMGSLDSNVNSSNMGSLDAGSGDDTKTPTADLAHWMEIVYGSILSLLFLVIVSSSVLVLLVVVTNSKLHSLPGYLMAALGICDLTMAVTSIIPSVLTIIWEKWLFTETGCYMQAYCQTYLGPLESSFIMFCALDRFSAIRSPLFYSQLEIYVLRYLKLIILITILINLPIPTAAAIIAKTVKFNPRFSHCVFSFDGHFVVPFLNYVLQYLLPGLVIIFCYSYIAVAAFRSKKEHLKTLKSVEEASRHQRKDANTTTYSNDIKPDQNNGGRHPLTSSRSNDVTNGSSSADSSAHSFFRHLKLCKMLFIITFVYILSFLPNFLYGFLVAFDVIPFNIYFYKVIHFLTYINGAFNALIYYSMSVVFKDGFHRTMSKLFPNLAFSDPSEVGEELLDSNGNKATQIELQQEAVTGKNSKTGSYPGNRSNKKRPKFELDV